MKLLCRTFMAAREILDIVLKMFKNSCVQVNNLNFMTACNLMVYSRCYQYQKYLYVVIDDVLWEAPLII
jgi:hypothetical protein